MLTWNAFMWLPGAMNHRSSPKVLVRRRIMDAFLLSSYAHGTFFEDMHGSQGLHNRYSMF